MAQQIQLRKGTAAQWTAANPTLASGETGWEIDTRKVKVGDGSTAWISLAYVGANLQAGALASDPTVAPSAASVVTALSSVSGGLPVLTTYSDTILLDGVKYSSPQSLTANKTITPGAHVQGGSWYGSYTLNGYTLTPSGFTVINSATFNPSRIMQAVCTYQDSPQLIWVDLGAAPVLPTITSAVVADNNTVVIQLTFSTAMNTTLPAISAFVVSTGHTITAISAVDTTHFNLTVATQFLPGETQTLSYTQPGTNNLQDVSGNLVASFTGLAITDNVVYPTVTTAAVANSTPSIINLTLSEPIQNITLPATTTWVVTGHPITAVGYVDSTHINLTTSTAFVSGETTTLAYTSAANPILSLGGTALQSFSGLAITDGVTAASSLSLLTGASRAGTFDLDAATLGGASAIAFLQIQPSSGGVAYIKPGQAITLTRTYVGISGVPGANGGAVTYVSAAAGLNSSLIEQANASTTGTPVSYDISIVGLTPGQPYTAEYIGGTFSAGTTATIAVTVDDASATTTPINLAADNTTQYFKAHIQLGATTTAHMTLSAPNAAGGAQLFGGGIVIYPGTV